MQDCDFIPADYHRARALRRDVKVRAACVSVMIIIMILWVVTHEHELAQVNAMVDDVARQHEQIAIHLTKKTSMETERAKLQAHGRLIRVLQDHSSLVVVLSDVSRRMPDAIVLTELSAYCPSLARYAAPEEPAARPTGQKPESRHESRTALGATDRPTVNRIKMTGIAPGIPVVIEFAAALEDSRLFDRVQREMKKEKVIWGGRLVQQFELTCDLVTQARTKP